MLMTVQAVLFDLDGTLADTALDLARALNIELGKRHLPLVDAGSLKEVAGHGARAMVNFACPSLEDGEDKELLISDFLAEYEQNTCVETVLFSGVNDFLRDLQKKSIPWGIVTNKNMRFANKVIPKLPFATAPNVIVCGDTLSKAKPHPEPLLYAVKQLNVNAASCVYIGDGLRDIQAAKAAGMKSVAVDWGYISSEEDIVNWHADLNIQYLSELIVSLKHE